ncbi:DUF3618 domain-containing protein [Streptomyces spororaveus]|uniref:DUF3618 domain-containing protein n=1 Tax=Streptomyces spororaveus TaxID=284039 RepID=UPI0035582388
MPRRYDQPQGDGCAPTSEELREQVEHTHEELGQTVEALATKADVKAQAPRRVVCVSGLCGAGPDRCGYRAAGPCLRGTTRDSVFPSGLSHAGVPGSCRVWRVGDPATGTATSAGPAHARRRAWVR